MPGAQEVPLLIRVTVGYLGLPGGTGENQGDQGYQGLREVLKGTRGYQGLPGDTMGY